MKIKMLFFVLIFGPSFSIISIESIRCVISKEIIIFDSKGVPYANVMIDEFQIMNYEVGDDLYLAKNKTLSGYKWRIASEELDKNLLIHGRIKKKISFLEAIYYENSLIFLR